MSIPGLEKSLHQYTLEPSEKPFDMKSVPLATAPITEQKTGVIPPTPPSNCSSPHYFPFTMTPFVCQKSHQWLQVKLLKNWHLHAKTFTKVSRHVIMMPNDKLVSAFITPKKMTIREKERERWKMHSLSMGKASVVA